MTRDDGPGQTSGSKAAAGRRRLAKSKRTGGVGRTGARFPSASDFEPEEPEESESDAVPPVALSDADLGAAQAGGTQLGVRQPGGQSGDRQFGVAQYGSGRLDAQSGAAGPPPAPPPAATSASAASTSTSDLEPDSVSDEEAVGGTGARFGPYSVRKTKRAKDFDTGSNPVIPAQGMHPDHARPVGPGEPTPSESAERTVPLVLPWAGALVRPYAHTGGRTRSSHDLALEALISSSSRPGAGADALTTQHRRMIVDLCARPRSVAEVAALLSVPLGVARVLLGDLATAGAVIVHPTAGASGDGAPDVDFMHRVLVGLRRL